MASSGIHHTPSLDNATHVWDFIAERVGQFIDTWDSAQEPPPLADVLPPEPAGLRRMVLCECIKVDLEYRWREVRWPKLLEDYIAEFPELGGTPSLPSDLIYEEFHARRQAGQAPNLDDYLARFPERAEEIGRMLGSEIYEPTFIRAATPAATVQVGEQLLDFDLLQRLGQGAFATVFLAMQRSMQRFVALKVSVNRSNEPQTLAQLDHPHIVRVYDQRVIEDRGLRLLYMQFLPGGTLHQLVEMVNRTPPDERTGALLMDAVKNSLAERDQTPPPASIGARLEGRSWPEAVCWLGARLAEALDYAHRRGILHRDVKPANVLLAADGSPKLADFNISFSSQLEGQTAAAYFGGSLAYMSPEQLEAFHSGHARRADELDGRIDQYSLCVVLWELLAGKRPFRDLAVAGEWSKTLDEMIAQRRGGLPADAFDKLPADLPEGLVGVLKRCLAPERERRFATAADMAAALNFCLQPEVRQLLRPPDRSWRCLAMGFPLLALMIAGVIPNIVMSILNIAYNWNLILKELPGEAQQMFFSWQVTLVNIVAYGLGIGVLYALARPVLEGVSSQSRHHPLEPSRVRQLYRRSVLLPEIVASVSAVLWVVTGFVFPTWLHWQLGALSARHYVGFITSNTLYGFIAGTWAFFFVGVIVTRVYFPALWQTEVDPADAVQPLRRLYRRTSLYFGFAVFAPFLVILVYVASGWLLPPSGVTRPDAAQMLQNSLRAFAVLAAAGFVGLPISYWLSRFIQRDLGTLNIALSSPQDPWTSNEDSLTSSRNG